MKKNFKAIMLSTITAVGLLGVYSCTDPDDLVTDGAKGGGLTTPVDDNLSFVGAPVDIAVETTAGITDVTFFKTFTADGITSAEVEGETIEVVDGEASFTADYAALKAGLAGLPATSGELNVGDFWTLRIVSTLSSGRKVETAARIKITVDNPYSGTYAASGTRWNYASAGDADVSTMPPGGTIASSSNFSFNTNVTTVGSTTCRVHVGNAEQATFGYMNIQVNEDNTVDIIPTSETILLNVAEIPGWKSNYDPETKKFTLYYTWTNDTGTHRIIRETLTRVE